MKRVLLLTTGGTISCGTSVQGLSPQLAGAEFLPYLSLPADIVLEVKDIFQLDSTNLQPAHWETIAEVVSEGIKQYDGVVIAHGTDTMAYTSSMLSYLFYGMNKPVVLTGSQLPISENGSDGPGNLQDAVLTASSGRAGVFVVFSGRIFYGARVHKAFTKKFDAFISPNAPQAGEVENHQKVIWRDEVVPCCMAEQRNVPSLNSPVLFLKLVPGMKAGLLSSVFSAGYRGLVLEAFGAGNVPFLGEDLVEEIRRISAQFPVVVCTQCQYGGVDLSLYSTGALALEAGAIPAGDMTPEAVYTKLIWALGQTERVSLIRRMFETVYCNEMTKE